MLMCFTSHTVSLQHVNPMALGAPPAALALGGVGCGVLIGAERKDVIIFAMDDPTFDAISEDFQYKIGGQVRDDNIECLVFSVVICKLSVYVLCI